MALDYAKRPDYNPADGFYTVKLMSPSGTNLPQIYSGERWRIDHSDPQVRQLAVHQEFPLHVGQRAGMGPECTES